MEIQAALLVLAEICVLFAGVMARYVFHVPLIWSDELASMLFLWLAMLGAVAAFRRGQHMRMTAVVALAGPGGRALFEVLAVMASPAFLALTIGPALEFAEEELVVTTPALEISNAWRASALPVGIGLMLVVGVLRPARGFGWRWVVTGSVVTAAVSTGFALAQPRRLRHWPHPPRRGDAADRRLHGRPGGQPGDRHRRALALDRVPVTPRETETLFRLMARLKTEGVTIVHISHKPTKWSASRTG